MNGTKKGEVVGPSESTDTDRLLWAAEDFLDHIGDAKKPMDLLDDLLALRRAVNDYRGAQA